MDKIIKHLYQNVIENSQYTKDIDKKLEDYLSKIVSVFPDSFMRKDEDFMLGIEIEMLQYAKENMFILGFRYATQLWTEAIMDYDGEKIWKRPQNMEEY